MSREVTIPSLVGVKIVPIAPLTLIKPFVSNGMLKALIMLCRRKTVHVDLLMSRSSPKRMAVGNMTRKPMTRKTGMLVVRALSSVARSRN